ncbi:hypothetical protein G9A89_000808 [Geosiphon pyriformis]|nr:hypothetical protein G9A89_000808 [Geosiphon pyriformis]
MAQEIRPYKETPQRNRFLTNLSGIGNNSNNMIGAGIFSTPGLVLSSAGSPGMALIYWILGAFVSLFGSLSYAELGSSIRDGGGEVVYLRESFRNPRALFTSAIRPGAMAAEANIVAQYIIYSFTANDPCDASDNLHPEWNLKSYEFWRIRTISAAILVIMAYNMLPSKWANRINQALAIIKILTLTTVALIGFIYMKRSIVNWGNDNWKNYFKNSRFTLKSFISSMLPVLFTYSGWNNLNFMVDELVPEASLTLSNILSVVLVSILYILVNIAYTIVPYNLAVQSGSGLSEIIGGQLASAIGGQTAARILAFFIACSAFGALGVVFSTGARIIVAAAHREYIPWFSPWLRQWNTRTDTPVNAMAAQAIWCLLITLCSPTSDPFKFLVSVSEHSSFAYLGLTVFGLVLLQRRGVIEQRLIPRFIPIIFALFAALIFIGSFVSDETTQNQEQNHTNFTLLINGDERICDSHYTKTTYPYYLPYLTSIIVALIGAIFWYFSPVGVKIIFQPNISNHVSSVYDERYESFVYNEKHESEPHPIASGSGSQPSA